MPIPRDVHAKSFGTSFPQLLLSSTPTSRSPSISASLSGFRVGFVALACHCLLVECVLISDRRRSARPPLDRARCHRKGRLLRGVRRETKVPSHRMGMVSRQQLSPLRPGNGASLRCASPRLASMTIRDWREEAYSKTCCLWEHFRLHAFEREPKASHCAK